MGVVVAAQHLALDKRVAIKLMRPELRVRRDLVRRFLREARATARLNSPHIAHVFDVGTIEEGVPYIVMEYLDGMNLAAWLRQHGPAPVPLAAAMVLQVCDAIAEAHSIGIVHRDLKPANLFVTHDSDGELLVKVLDLGICKLVERTDDLPDTSLATALGTPAYTAPEQRRKARRVDARADIWSLGVVLYELVTGRVPFHGQTPAELSMCATRDPPRLIERAGMTSELEAIVARCLASDPAARFQSVPDLVVALAPFAHGARTVAGAKSRLARGSRWRRRPWLSTAVIVAAFAIAGVSGPQLAPVPPPPPGPALLPSVVTVTRTATQPAPALHIDDLVQSHVEPAPAAPVPSRPRSTTPGARVARVPRNAPPASVGSGATPEPAPEPAPPPAPPRAPLDPLSTPY
jgi:eukaryotic-like serine/threonine-protein kinase